MCDKLRELQFNAQCNIIQNKFKSKGYYDKKNNPVHFSEGNEIYLINTRPGNKQKIKVPWSILYKLHRLLQIQRRDSTRKR